MLSVLSVAKGAAQQGCAASGSQLSFRNFYGC